MCDLASGHTSLSVQLPVRREKVVEGAVKREALGVI